MRKSLFPSEKKNIFLSFSPSIFLLPNDAPLEETARPNFFFFFSSYFPHSLIPPFVFFIFIYKSLIFVFNPDPPIPPKPSPQPPIPPGHRERADLCLRASRPGPAFRAASAPPSPPPPPLASLRRPGLGDWRAGGRVRAGVHAGNIPRARGGQGGRAGGGGREGRAGLG